MNLLLKIKQHKSQTLFLGVIAFVLLLSWLNVLDNRTRNYVSESITEATVAFGVARVLNAVISTFQTSTVEFSLGVGGSISPGEILDPINDLVEDYSTLMKVSIVSLVIQALLLEILSDMVFKLILTLITFLFLFSWIVKNDRLIYFFFKTFVFICFIRFSLVLVVFLSGIIDDAFIKQKIELELNDIKLISSNLDSYQNESNKKFDVQIDLRKELEFSQKKRAEFKKQLPGREKQLETVKKDIERLEISKQAIQDKQNITDRFFSENKEIDDLNRQIEHRERDLKDFKKTVEDLEEKIELLNETIDDINEQLNEKGDGFFKRFDEMKVYVDGSYLNNIQQEIDGAINSIMRVMAHFLFKTLIMPLLFLLLLVQGTRFIWGVDLEKTLNISVKRKNSTL